MYSDTFTHTMFESEALAFRKFVIFFQTVLSAQQIPKQHR